MSSTTRHQQELDIGGGELSVNGERVTITLLPSKSGWTALSSAVWNGGIKTVLGGPLHVLNHKVHFDYDGVNPDPRVLLSRLAEKETFDANHTVGLMTAASMNTLRIASRQANGVIVNAVVTAGISNARKVGVDADYFLFASNKDGFGTINTVVITNAALSESALVEAYAIVIEAKCAACADLQVVCTKSGDIAQGTGTDCAVLISNNSGIKVQHAGKHTLFAEMVGQAVYEATREALLSNISHMYGSRLGYATRRWRLKFSRIICGARPCIPEKPMMPVPWAPLSVIVMGAVAVLLAYTLPLSRSAQILLAVMAWDRCLGEPPLCIHPVVLVGNLITLLLSCTPKQVFDKPTLGFVCGSLLLFIVLNVSLSTSWLLLETAASLSTKFVDASQAYLSDSRVITATKSLLRFSVWLMEVLLVKSTVSVQLLCTIALQMAKFLERKQLSEARNQLSWLCSRDPSSLTSTELAGATLESLSENLCDGLVAPLVWYTALGPLGALGYRVINTLDSRVGYRGKMEWYGKPSARIDDLLNIVPARMTALLLVMAAFCTPDCHALNGLSVAWNDSSQCKSPNAGWPMGAMAGVLGVQLEKKGEYCLGARGSPPNAASIRLGQRVAQLAGGLAVILAVLACSFAGVGVTTR